jgi:hypothetical protein
MPKTLPSAHQTEIYFAPDHAKNGKGKVKKKKAPAVASSDDAWVPVKEASDSVGEAAGNLFSSLGGLASSAAGAAGKGAGQLAGAAGNGFAKWFTSGTGGLDAGTLFLLPPAVLLSLYAGYRGASQLGSKLRQRRLDKLVDTSKARYSNELQKSYTDHDGFENTKRSSVKQASWPALIAALGLAAAFGKKVLPVAALGGGTIAALMYANKLKSEAPQVDTLDPKVYNEMLRQRTLRGAQPVLVSPVIDDEAEAEDDDEPKK